jgi:hypothetical protein
MTLRDVEREIHRAPQITVQLEITPELLNALQEWSVSVPTLYFLDICVVNFTKQSSSVVEKDARKARLIGRLRDLDRPQHRFSYLLALIEKVSDPRVRFSDDELEAQVLGDVAALRAFFQNATVVETDEFLVGYLRELRRNPHESMRPQYRTFLLTANNRFKLRDPVSPRGRFQMAQAILQEADALSISRQHPLILLTLACLYGNLSAKKIMKFKADAETFDAENALTDIMVISRFPPRKLEIEDAGRRGTGCMRSEFITDDRGLLGVLKCFDVLAASFNEGNDVYRTRTDVRVNLLELLADLAPLHQSRPKEMEDSAKGTLDEYGRICELLLQPTGALP